MNDWRSIWGSDLDVQEIVKPLDIVVFDLFTLKTTTYSAYPHLYAIPALPHRKIKYYLTPVQHTTMIGLQVNSIGEYEMFDTREFLADLIVPAMKLSGFRFSKEYRRGTTAWKRLVYRHVSTMYANVRAGL